MVTDQPNAIYEIDAPAKVNLFLHLVGRRDDGYHLIESLFAFADIGDRLRVTPAAELSLSIEGPFAAELEAAGGGGEENLVLKAARMLRRRTGAIEGAQISLQKRLPVASGLGGGSSDAASALLALNRVWDTGLSSTELATIALELGADVPACLSRRACLVTGIGEAITPIKNFPDLPVLLVNPLVEVNTGEIFRRFHRQGRSFTKPVAGRYLDSEFQISDLAGFQNDLQLDAIDLVPEIGTILSALSEQSETTVTRMSGSGATCFALFDTNEARDRAFSKLAKLGKKWWICQANIGSVGLSHT